MDGDERQQRLERAQITESLRQEFEAFLPQRVERYLQVKPHAIIPNTPFSAPSSECALLFRDGHFYACIALVQAVSEAIVRYMCGKRSMKPRKVFEENVKKLHTRNFIDDKLGESLLAIWDKRDAYHHLNPSVEPDRQALESLAKQKTCLLRDIETQVFGFDIADGAMVPKHPVYWTITNGKAQVFLRMD